MVNSDSTPETKADKPSKTPPRPWRGNLLRALAGLALGVVIAEGLFYWRDQGAFPHLNIYVADATVGLRLRPNATQRVRFGGGPVTAVRTNSQGYRGGEWAAPADGEVLVVGDSQAFGLGVEEDQTFSAVLSRTLGVPVLNAGVPTWGPPEYNAALEQILATRKPKVVIWVVNAYNDFFEADRRNADRHAELDGWAVRRELAPDPVLFPGRTWLFSHSHAVYNLRRWLYGRKPDPNALGTPSEGTWRDLIGASEPVEKTRAANASVQKEYLHVRDDELRIAQQALVSAQAHVEKLAEKALPSAITSPGDGVTLSTIRSTPGDIVDYGDGGEFARPGPVTVDHIRIAVRARNRAVELLRERAAKEKGSEDGKRIEDAIAKETELTERVKEARDQPVLLVRALSPLSRRIEEARQLCDKAGAELLVLAIPMDVQVSAEEWKKYQAVPVELESTRVLLTDAVESAVAIGARGWDATDALRASGAGSFLPLDLHMSAKGHEAVAAGIAQALKAERPHLPRGGLPPGRSRAPTFAEWKSVGETLVYGSTARACVTKRIREWLSLWCTEGSGYDSTPVAAHNVRVVKGGRGETIVTRWVEPKYEYDDNTRQTLKKEGQTRSQMVLIAPVLPGDELVADFFWPGKRSTLVVRLPKELESQTVEFQKFVKEESEPMPVTPEAQKLCDCHVKLSGEETCLNLGAMPNADCQRTWGDDCAGLVGCSSGNPAYAPTCLSGFANGGALERCIPLCGPGKTCPQATTCVDWQGGGLCMAQLLTEPSSRVDLLMVPAESSPATVELARAVIKAGAGTVDGCKLVNENEPSVYYDVYDNCPLDAAVVDQVIAAVRALESHVATHGADADGRARVFARRAVLFADWIDLARARRFARGTLPAFADLATVWNEWQPSEKVQPYNAPLLRQYEAGLRTKGRAGPPQWVTCKTGPCL